MTPRKKEQRGKGQGARPGTPHQQANGNWLQYVTVEGKRHKCQGKTRNDVLEQVAALRAGVNHPARREARELGPTLQELCNTALDVYQAEDEAATRRVYNAAYKKWQHMLGANTRRNTITGDNVQAAVDSLGDTLAARTVRTYVAALHVALGKKHPALDEIELPGFDDKPKLLVPFDLATRLQTVARHHPYGVLIGLGFGAGPRPGEACAIRWADVDLDRGEIIINGSIKPGAQGGWRRGKTKTRKGRVVTIHTDLVEWLHLHRRIQTDTARIAGYPVPEYVAAHIETGQPLARHAAVKVLRALLAEVCTPAELKIYGVLRYHDLRHTHLSNLIAAGVGLPDVAERAGHSLKELMRTYAHAIPGAGPRIAQITGVLFPIFAPQATAEATTYQHSALERGQMLTRALTQA